MCVPVKNSWSVPPVLRPNPSRTFSGLGFRRADYAKNSASVAVSPASPSRVMNNAAVCVIGGGDPQRAAWSVTPLPYPPPAGFSLVVLTVSNVNQITDDVWDFKIDGETVATYDGGGQTTLSFYAYLPSGQSHELSATDTADQGYGNYFGITLTVNQVDQINTTEGGGGVGSTSTYGTFNT